MTSGLLCMQSILGEFQGKVQLYPSLFTSFKGRASTENNENQGAKERCDSFPREGDTSETLPGQRPAKEELESHLACKQTLQGCKLDSSLSVWHPSMNALIQGSFWKMNNHC